MYHEFKNDVFRDKTQEVRCLGPWRQEALLNVVGETIHSFSFGGPDLEFDSKSLSCNCSVHVDPFVI